LPLRRLALCLDCEDCFEIGGDACPACGSETWCPMARFLGGRSVRGGEAVRQLIVVARDRHVLFEELRRAFAGNATVQVVLDRRAGDRRQRRLPQPLDRRTVERRRRRETAEDLRTRGWALVRLR
jgi:hypothetical protein